MDFKQKKPTHLSLVKGLDGATPETYEEKLASKRLMFCIEFMSLLKDNLEIFTKEEFESLREVLGSVFNG
jgi:hypothetical protein